MQESGTERDFWVGARDIVHFVGICGAGKTTLAQRLATRCARHGAKALTTIDWDPHTPDHEQGSKRAFSRALDLENNAAGRTNPAIHRKIVDHTLGLLAAWAASDANLIAVDRWYESYDDLPLWCRAEIESAILAAGFRLQIVCLTVDEAVLADRLIHTRNHRPSSWWQSGPGSVEEWVREESACQDAYAAFCASSRFPSACLDTAAMDWDLYEEKIVNCLVGNTMACAL